MTSLEKQLRDFKKQGGWVDVRYNGNTYLVKWSDILIEFSGEWKFKNFIGRLEE